MAETKKRIQPGEIVASSDEKAVLLHVQIVESQLPEGATEWEVVKRTDDTRKLRISEALTADADLEGLAKRMQAGCKYIKESALPKVLDALRVLQQREAEGGGAVAAAAPPQRPASRHGPETRREEPSERKGERRSGDSGRSRKGSSAGGGPDGEPHAKERPREKSKRSSDKKKSRREQMSSAPCRAWRLACVT